MQHTRGTAVRSKKSVFITNKRITPKDRNAIKGAIRRAFSRSELRKSVLKDAEIEHSDPKRPRVKKWCYCAVCGVVEAKSYLQVDHIKPVIPNNTSFEGLGVDETVNRMWCVKSNLQAICDTCHTLKTKRERKRG